MNPFGMPKSFMQPTAAAELFLTLPDSFVQSDLVCLSEMTTVEVTSSKAAPLSI